MLNDRETKIRNLKVQRMNEERILHDLDYPPASIVERKSVVKGSLPKIDPSKRVFVRPCNGVKFRNRTKAAIPTAFPQRNTLREYLRGDRT